METLEIIAEVEKKAVNSVGISELYEEVFPAVAKFIKLSGGSLDDAKDVFHDALVIFLEKNNKENTAIITSEKAYILGISKHVWYRKHKNENLRMPLSEMENQISIPDDYFLIINQKRLLRFLKLAGKKCMDLLRAFYFQNESIKEIVNDLGYANEHSASVQKYKCLEKIRNTVKEKSMAYDDFTE